VLLCPAYETCEERGRESVRALVHHRQSTICDSVHLLSHAARDCHRAVSCRGQTSPRSRHGSAHRPGHVVRDCHHARGWRSDCYLDSSYWAFLISNWMHARGAGQAVSSWADDQNPPPGGNSRYPSHEDLIDVHEGRGSRSCDDPAARPMPLRSTARAFRQSADAGWPACRGVPDWPGSNASALVRPPTGALHFACSFRAAQ